MFRKGTVQLRGAWQSAAMQRQGLAMKVWLSNRMAARRDAMRCIAKAQHMRHETRWTALDWWMLAFGVAVIVVIRIAGGG
jgi:hypothetical protein